MSEIIDIDKIQETIRENIKENQNKNYNNRLYDFMNNWKISLLKSVDNIIEGEPQNILSNTDLLNNEKPQEKDKYNQLFYIALTFIFVFLFFIVIKFLKVLL